MTREPKCYPTKEDEFVCTLGRRSENSIGITVPKAIMRAQCLRPGMVVRVHIERMPPRPKEPEEDDGKQQEASE